MEIDQAEIKFDEEGLEDENEQNEHEAAVEDHITTIECVSFGMGKLNNDVSENEKCGESDPKNSDVFKKQYAVVLKQLQEDNVKVSSALCQLRQRNSYNRNLSLPWTRPTTNIGDYGANLSSFNSFLRGYKAYASREGGENTFEKIEEAIDHVNDQLSKMKHTVTGSFLHIDHTSYLDHFDV
ncbi:hypothetical protein POM88_023354 [Heracleum sosnowskyi]|uniref:Uncharacterized protein n=1 Tax=Heracleum sosnowskyi TaxID=360622 RepID=A0AAD8IIJ6_9APIA|nr:hypothetical protein POM88_023354 [Heracleum sosnowskyi]